MSQYLRIADAALARLSSLPPSSVGTQKGSDEIYELNEQSLSPPTRADGPAADGSRYERNELNEQSRAGRHTVRATREEVIYWLQLLREEGVSITIAVDGSLVFVGPPEASNPGRLRELEHNRDVITEVLKDRGEGLIECSACRSIDTWTSPAGAVVCRTCKRVQSNDDTYERSGDWWDLIDEVDRKRLNDLPRGSQNRCPHMCASYFDDDDNWVWQARVLRPDEWIVRPNGRFCPHCGGHNHQDRCPWCGGVHHHAKTCQELHDGWQSRLPWGKHKGHKLGDVATDYLQWLSRREIDDELRDSVRRELDRRQVRYHEETRKDD